MFEAFENLPVFSSHVGTYGRINNPHGPSSVMPSGYSCRGKIGLLLSLPREIRVRRVRKAVFFFSTPILYAIVMCNMAVLL